MYRDTNQNAHPAIDYNQQYYFSMRNFLLYIVLFVSAAGYGQMYSTANGRSRRTDHYRSSYGTSSSYGYSSGSQRIGYTKHTGYTTSYTGYSTLGVGRSVITPSAYGRTDGHSSGEGYGSTPTFSGRKKSPERPDPGNNVWDWLRMNGFLGYGYDEKWPDYVDGDYWEEFLTNYPKYKTYVEEWFAAHPEAPNNPFTKTSPVGDIPWVMMLILGAGYCVYRRRRLAGVG